MSDVMIQDTEFKWVKVKIPDNTNKSLKRTQSKNVVYITSKTRLQRLTDDIWDKCPKCGEPLVYLLLHPGGIGDSIDIECYNCGHKKDASHVEDW